MPHSIHYLSITTWLQSLEVDQLFNFIEALFWIAIALGFLVSAIRQKTHRDLAVTSVIAFLAFGISDLIEIQTRAWYTPISLFAFKAACVITFLITLTIFSKRKKRLDQRTKTKTDQC